MPVQNVRMIGLQDGGRVSVVALVHTEWRPLPATALPNRNGLAIQNQSLDEIKINYGTPAGYEGILIAAGDERFYSITDGVVLYGRSKTGPADIAVEELA